MEGRQAKGYPTVTEQLRWRGKEARARRLAEESVIVRDGRWHVKGQEAVKGQARYD